MERPYTFSSNFFRLLESNNELFDEETFQQVLQERIEFTRELTSIQASYPDTGSIASAASHVSYIMCVESSINYSAFVCQHLLSYFK